MAFHFTVELVSCICVLTLKNNNRVINLYFNFVVNQDKWLILLETFFWIILELPCHVVLVHYELDAHDVLVDILFEDLLVTQGQ